MLLLGQNRICRGRSPLAFLAKLLILFLVYLFLISLKRRVINTITQAKQTNKKKAQQTGKTEIDMVLKMMYVLQESRECKNH